MLLVYAWHQAAEATVEAVAVEESVADAAASPVAAAAGAFAAVAGASGGSGDGGGGGQSEGGDISKLESSLEQSRMSAVDSLSLSLSLPLSRELGDDSQLALTMGADFLGSALLGAEGGGDVAVAAAERGVEEEGEEKEVKDEKLGVSFVLDEQEEARARKRTHEDEATHTHTQQATHTHTQEATQPHTHTPRKQKEAQGRDDLSMSLTGGGRRDMTCPLPLITD
jgi:hypothetical protein